MKLYNDSLHNLAYNTDASHLSQNSDIEVYIPENKEEIIEIIKKGITENKKIVCRGGGTSLVGNCLPGDKNIVLDISKLDKVFEINKDNVIVETGITNDTLNDILIGKGLFFPVVLGSHAGAEIGGMISTNGGGMRAIKYGKMGNRVEELEVLIVNQDKEIGIKTLKGIECKEFIGSEGKLGILLSTKLKIINKPSERSIDFESFNNIKESLEYVNDIKVRNEKDLTALEIINPQVAGYLNLEKKYYILAEYENNEIGKIKETNKINNVRKNRDSCYAVTINAGYDQIEDPEIHSNQEEFFKRFEENNIPIFGHIGIGVLHPHFKSTQKELTNKMYEMVKKFGGKISGEHGIGKKKISYLSEDTIKENEILKNKRDPNNIFGY